MSAAPDHQDDLTVVLADLVNLGLAPRSRAVEEQIRLDMRREVGRRSIRAREWIARNAKGKARVFPFEQDQYGTYVYKLLCTFADEETRDAFKAEMTKRPEGDRRG